MQHINSRPQIINVGEDVEPKEQCTLLVGIQIHSATLKKSIKVHEETKNRTTMCLVAQSCPTLGDPMDHGVSPGKNTGVGCHNLLQGIFPTRGSNPGLLHCRWILYHLRHQGSPRTLKRVAYPFSRGSFQPRNWTRVSCIAGRFFTCWATREALCCV